jgi:peptidyl-prolyl cis-trans isomerase SurA
MRKTGFMAVLLLSVGVLGGCGVWNDMWGIPDEDAIPKGPAPKCDVNLPSCSGGMVLPVNGELITVNEVISGQLDDLRPIAEKGDYIDFRRNARPLIEQSITNRVSNIVLHQKAKKEMKEGVDEQLDKLADTEVRQFLAGFNGNYADAEKAVKKMGMDWKSYREFQKKRILVGYFLSEELKDKRPITYSEMRQYYESARDEQFHTSAMVQFRVIDIMPEKLVPDANDPNLTRAEAAKRLAAVVMEKLKAGGEFTALAKQYSMDPVRAPLGGLWSPATIGSLAVPYDVLETTAMKLEPGQTAGPIEAKNHIFILKLESKRAESYEPFEEVQHKVEMSIKFQRQREALDKFTNKLMAQADIGDRNAFLELCLQKAYQQVKQN